MQSTGHSSTHARSLTPIQGSAMTYVTLGFLLLVPSCRRAHDTREDLADSHLFTSALASGLGREPPRSPLRRTDISLDIEASADGRRTDHASPDMGPRGRCGDGVASSGSGAGEPPAPSHDDQEARQCPARPPGYLLLGDEANRD